MLIGLKPEKYIELCSPELKHGAIQSKFVRKYELNSHYL